MTQERDILRDLLAGRVVDGYRALERYGCFRLAARIYDLRHHGWDIRTRLVKTRTGKRIACYILGRA